MPELPEVETIRRDLAKHLPGVRVDKVWTSGKPLRMARPIDARAIRRVAVGHQVTGLRRIGKYLLIDTDAGAATIVHLGMSGWLLIVDAQTPRPPHTHVVWTLTGGRELRFVDPRRFGWVTTALHGRERDLEELQVLGVDPLDEKAFTNRHLWDLCQASKRSMKTFLLDQSKIAGLGNIYVVEALHRAGIHPSTIADKLSRPRVTALRRMINDVLEGALTNRGTTFSLYRDAEGRKGRNQFQLRVYDREGQACPKCKAKIVRSVDQGRSTYFCPRCQKR